jgi:hypothetical protein
MQTSQTKLSERKIAQAWAQITVEHLWKNLKLLKKGGSGKKVVERS